MRWRSSALPRPGPDGRVLVLPSPTSRFEALTLVVPAGRGWATRPLPVEPGALAVAASGDGDRYAALAYSTATGGEAPGCRLALLDLATVVVVGNPVVGGADVPLPHAHCSWSPSLTRDAPAPTEE